MSTRRSRWSHTNGSTKSTKDTLTTENIGDETRTRSDSYSNTTSGKEVDEGFTLEDVSGQDIGYEADVEVIRPYEYEDAGSRPQSRNSSRSIKRLGHDDLWTTGLIDSMNMLRCDSDKEMERRRTSKLHKRGRKRKSRDSLGDHYRSGTSSPSSRRAFLDVIDQTSVSSPQKLRKRNLNCGEASDTTESSRTQSSRLESRSPAVPPDETSGDGDQMDID